MTEVTDGQTTDVLVIGGGVIGAAAALACADGGARVSVLSGSAPPATLAAGGMLCPSLVAMHVGGRRLARLGAESLAMWDGFAARASGGAPDALDYRRGGVLGVGYPRGFLRGSPVPSPRGVEAQDAVLVPGEGQVDPRRLLAALHARLAEAGVRVIEADAERLLTEGDRVTGAGTACGDLRAARTILAAGAGADAGAGLLPERRLHPVRGRAFAARLPEGAALDLPGAGVLRAPSVYLCQKADGTIYVGATEELRAADAVLEGLWHEACWLVPMLRDAARVRTFDGVRPGTADGLPIIEPAAEAPGLYLAIGHHRNGVLLAPLTAHRAADWALGQPSGGDERCLHPGRPLDLRPPDGTDP